jgi:hypothetical protein
MPCDSVQTSQVSFNLQATDLKLLKTALEGLGYRVTHNEQQKSLSFSKGYGELTGIFQNGKFNVEVRSSYGNEPDFNVNSIKVAYSKEVVRHTANRFGWKLSDKGVNKNGNLQYEAQKRFGI